MNLTALIARAYPSPEWATFFEVANATGSGARRRGDAVALGIWPSRGHTLIGFEFKTDRGDWLREKKNPAKAEEIARHCDLWYLVTSAKGIALPEELPEPWGLLVASEKGDKLHRMKEAVPFPDRDKAIVRRAFVAAMLRKVGETTVPTSLVEATVKERVAQAVERTREGHELKWATERADKLEKILEEFHAHSGVNLRHGWQGPAKIGAAVAAVLNCDARADLERARTSLGVTLRQLDEALAAWPAQNAPPDRATIRDQHRAVSASRAQARETSPQEPEQQNDTRQSSASPAPSMGISAIPTETAPND